jgi:hypothetical protein
LELTPRPVLVLDDQTAEFHTCERATVTLGPLGVPDCCFRIRERVESARATHIGRTMVCDLTTSPVLDQDHAGSEHRCDHERLATVRSNVREYVDHLPPPPGLTVDDIEIVRT